MPEPTADISDAHAALVLSSINASIDSLQQRDKLKTKLIAICIMALVAAGAIISWQASALYATQAVAECRAKAFGVTFDDTVIGLTDENEAERAAAFTRINARPTLDEQYEQCAD